MDELEYGKQDPLFIASIFVLRKDWKQHRYRKQSGWLLPRKVTLGGVKNQQGRSLCTN